MLLAKMRMNPPRVLVVDDDAPLRRALVRELSTCFHVVEATSAAEALGLLASVDAVVSDFDLGGASGLDVLRAAMTIRPACVRILVSGGADPSVVAEPLRDGVAHRFLEKPWRSGAVADALRSLLASSSEKS